MKQLADLPVEILDQILDGLRTQDQLKLQQVCKFFRLLCSERLWSSVELNLATEKRSPLIGQDRWTKHYTGRSKDCRRTSWMVLNKSNIQEFFDAYKHGLLDLVLPVTTTINIIENVAGYEFRNRISGPVERSLVRIHPSKEEVRATSVESNEAMEDQYGLILQLDPDHLPSLELIRVCSSISDSKQGGASLDLLSKFPSVEKYIWATRLSGQWLFPQYNLGAITKKTTSLSIYVGQLNMTDSDSNVLTCFSPLLPSLETLQLTAGSNGRCIITGQQIKQFLSHATNLKSLSLLRVEVFNPNRVDWLPKSATRLQLHVREDRRRDARVEEENPVNCRNIEYLYVNMCKGRDSLNLRTLKFTNLSSLFYLSPKRDAGSNFEVNLFRSNRALKRVVYNCSSSAGMKMLADSCGQSLEVLSFQRPMTRSLESLMYNLDEMEYLAKSCQCLRFLTLSGSSRQMINILSVLKEFIGTCPTLEEVYLVSAGRFSCKHFHLMPLTSVFDGFCHQALKPTRQFSIYKVNLVGFKRDWIKTKT